MSAKACAACVTLAALPLIASASTNIPAVPPARALTVPLSGSAEVGEIKALHLAGDMDASGQLKLIVDPDRRRICYDFKVAGVATPLMAHIHKGATQENGPSVVTLFTGPGGNLQDCLTWTQKWVDKIAADPAGFYVNLYTTEFPEGALRGQLGS